MKCCPSRLAFYFSRPADHFLKVKMKMKMKNKKKEKQTADRHNFSRYVLAYAVRPVLNPCQPLVAYTPALLQLH